MTHVVHHPRVAWDAARLLVLAARSVDTFPAAAARLGEALPEPFWQEYLVTRNRLVRSSRPDADSVEAGLWRHRLTELLRERPEYVDPLLRLTDVLRTAC